MGALIRAITNSSLATIEQALNAPDTTSREMRMAICQWFDAWFQREPDDRENPCQRLPYAIVAKLEKAAFAEYDSAMQGPNTAKLKYLDGARQAFDACRRELMQWAIVGGTALAKPVISTAGLTWHAIRRDGYLVLGRSGGALTDVATAEKRNIGDRHYTLIERRTVERSGRLMIQNRLYLSESEKILGKPCPLSELPQYADLPETYVFPTPIGGVGLVEIKMPAANCVDGSADGVSAYEPALGLIHAINRNEWLLDREFELGRMRLISSSDLLTIGPDGKRTLKDDLFVGLDGSQASTGITAWQPSLRNANYEQRRQAYLKAVENLLGIKRGILSDVEAAERTATEITSSAGDYALTIGAYQSTWYDAMQEALRLADALGQACGLCDTAAWDKQQLSISWGNGVLYDKDKEWADRLAMVQAGMLKPELALAWRFDLPCETPEDLAAIRANYMPELAELES
jgi:hypothetical protein